MHGIKVLERNLGGVYSPIWYNHLWKPGWMNAVVCDKFPHQRVSTDSREWTSCDCGFHFYNSFHPARDLISVYDIVDSVTVVCELAGHIIVGENGYRSGSARVKYVIQDVGAWKHGLAYFGCEPITVAGADWLCARIYE